MNTIKGIFVACLVAVLAGCGHSDYKKTSTGMVYDIIRDGKGDTIRNGDWLKVNYKAVLSSNDSVLESTYEHVPAYGPYDSSRTNLHNFVDILGLMRVGDSAVMTRYVDTMMKMGQIPPGDSILKPGGTIKVYLKVIGKFKNQQEIEADYVKEEEKELQREIASLKQYLTEKKISFVQSSKGVLVQITNPGTGAQVDTGKQVSVMYRGTDMKGNMFDSNMDPQFNHMGQPIDFVVGTGQIIPGWDDALRLFKEGGKGKLYIPAMLAYKNQQASAIIKPYTNLVFDVEVKAVKPAPAASAIPQPPVPVQ